MATPAPVVRAAIALLTDQALAATSRAEERERGV